ncbi:FMN-binding protein [Frankia sp. B2]|nr:FMN-binding protein [Frankia sp. B2]
MALMGAAILVVGAKAATGHGERLVALAASPTAAGATPQPSAQPAQPSASAGTPAPSFSATAGSTGSGSAGTVTTRTVTGDAIDTRYGPVQVQLVLVGKKITDVVVLQMPDRERRDIEINERAVPILRQEVLDAQNARIDTVSGASYTSNGYAWSVQSALDKAGA